MKATFTLIIGLLALVLISDAIAADVVRINLVTVPNPYRFIKDQVGNRKVERVLEAAAGDGVLVIVVGRPQGVWSGKGITAVEKAIVIRNAASVIREVSPYPGVPPDFEKQVVSIKRSLLAQHSGLVSFNEVILGTSSASFATNTVMAPEPILQPPMYEPRPDKETPPPEKLTPGYLPQEGDAFVFGAVATIAITGSVILVVVRLRRRRKLQRANEEKIEREEEQLRAEEHKLPQRFLTTKTKVFLNVFTVGILIGNPANVSLFQTEKSRSSYATSQQASLSQIEAKILTSVRSKKEATFNIVDVSGSTKLARKQAKVDIRARLASGGIDQYLLAFGDSLAWLGEVTTLAQLDTLDRIKSNQRTRLAQPVLVVGTVADSLSKRGVNVNFVFYSDFKRDDHGDATLELIDGKDPNNSSSKVSTRKSVDSRVETAEYMTILIAGLLIVAITLLLLLFLKKRKPAAVPKRVLLKSPDGRTKEIPGKELLRRGVRLGTQLNADLRVENMDALSAYLDGRNEVPSMTVEYSTPGGSTKIQLLY